MPSDFMLNASPNANPLLRIFVEYVERTGPIDLRIFRLRDGYLKNNDAGTVDLVLEFALGGDNRGGANSALWSRLRRLDYCLHDRDSLIPDHAEVTFYITKSVQKAAATLLKFVPMVGVSPEQKLRDSIDSQAGNQKATYPALCDDEQVKYLCVALAAAIELTEDKRSQTKDKLSSGLILPEAAPAETIGFDAAVGVDAPEQKFPGAIKWKRATDEEYGAI